MKISKSQWLLFLALGVTTTRAATTTTTSTTTTAWIDQDYPKAVISLAVLAVAVLIGFGIAKLADWCYEREAVRDDASDISENTKELLKAQLALMGFRKPKKTGADGKVIVSKERQREVFNTWAQKVRVHKKKRLEEEAKAAKAGGKAPATPTSKSTPASARKSPTKSSSKSAGAKGKEDKFHDALQQWEDVDEMVPTVMEPKSPTPSTKSKQAAKSKTPTKNNSKAALEPVNHPSAVDVTSLSSADFDFIDETFKSLDKDNKTTGKPKTDTKQTTRPNKVSPVSPVGTELQTLKDTPNPQVQNKTQFSRYVREPTTISQGRPKSSNGAKSPAKAPSTPKR
ncbi:muscle M-line assembly protein unc-89-like [Lineus longissimus]|uniref:muscle M-line assembly protein unc-89-like n=1 Tax=Lineus longissimus TaxID=88925 RepID=UPI002B4CC461